MLSRVKTMRDVWDRGKRLQPAHHPPAFGGPLKEAKRYKIFPPEIEKYYLEHLKRKKAFLEAKDEITKIFADYENHLGEAGFSKI